MVAYETRIGKIDMSQEYLSKLIGHEVATCFGVVGMVPSGGRQRIWGKFSRNEPINTGIKVYEVKENVVVELHIMVTYGMNINAIATSITEKVKYIVKEATSIDVSKVVVKVDGITE